MPPVANRAIKPGERGPNVVWLSSQLAQIFGKAAEPGKEPVFDKAMVRQIKQFQLVQGLTPDGAVGSQTMMRLSAAADLTAPKLLREPVKKGK